MFTINSCTKIGKKTTPHLVLPIPDELEGLLKRLGVALPWATKISGSTSPNSLQNTGFHESFHYKIDNKMCISHYIYFPDSWEVSLLFFCVKGTSFHQQLVSAAWLKLGEHYAQGGLTAELCGSQTRGLSRNGPRGKLGNSIKNRLQTHICGSFQRYQ